MTTIFQEDFESDGNGTRYKTFAEIAGIIDPVVEFTDGAGDYFTRSDGSNIGYFVSLNGQSGSRYFAAQDTDGESPFADKMILTFDDIDIASYTNLSFSGLFAEDDDLSAQDWDSNSLVYVEARIDDGSWVKILQFASLGATNTEPGRDTDFDGIADGPSLTDTFANFSADISGYGELLDLRVTIENLDTGDEDIAFDNFQVTGDFIAEPVLSISDAVAVEGTGGTTDFLFTVKLDKDATGPFSVTVNTSDGSATAPNDYTAKIDEELAFEGYAGETKTVVVAVGPDADFEPDETFFVNLSNVIGAEVVIVDAQAQGTILNDDVVKIHQVQGAGESSPLEGADVTVEAIVTSLLQNSAGFTVGYFLQEEDADADADTATSEGIYVNDSSASVSVGDLVKVSGTVEEFFGLTRLTNVTDVSTIGTGLVLPTVSQFEINETTQLETLEGMRVKLISSESPLTVTENFNLDRFGSVAVSNGNKYQPTQLFDPETQSAEIAVLTAQNAANRLTIDDGITSPNPDTYILIDSGDGTPLEAGDAITETGPTLRLGAQVSSITGVLDYSFGEFKIQADGPLQTIDGTNEDTREPNAPDVGGDLKVASFNVLNFFTTIDEGSNGPGTGPDGMLRPRGADSEAELLRQTDKIVSALIELDADVIGLQEIENNGSGSDSAIAALVNALNAELGSEIYAAVDPGVTFVGADAITTGLIYRASAVSVVGADALVFAESSAADTFAIANDLKNYVDPGDQVQDLQRNRPATVATFVDKDGSEFTVAVNHFKSKGDSNLQDLYEGALSEAPVVLLDALLADPNYDQGDGQGFWNQVRTDAALELASWLDSNPTGASDPGNIIVLGDLNAYAKEDPVSALVEAGYSDLVAELIGPEAYSFVFGGQRGTLDYALASNGIQDNVTGVAEWHINADEPDLLNYDETFNNTLFYNDDLFASSDHDPVIVGLTLDDPTVTARLDFSDSGKKFKSHVEYSLEGEIIQTKNLGTNMGKINVGKAGIKIDADDGLNKSPEFLSSRGEGLAIYSRRGDDRSGDQMIDGIETLSMSLGDKQGLGDALDVAFEFVSVSGVGTIGLAFYSEGILVEDVEKAVMDERIAHDLAGNSSFDRVILSVIGDTEVEVDAVEFGRLYSDDFSFV